MAYTTGTMNLASMMNLETTFKLWTYTTTDAEATVKGAGYVTDATKKGMLKGDMVLVINAATPTIWILQVASVTAGAATIGATVAVT